MQFQKEMKPQDRRLIQPQPQPQKCPRCDSLNTKFCYYNNYSLTQPRYLCKTCRRYWTQGGTLRNVPVGGGCRKSKKAKQSSDSGENSTSNLPPEPEVHPSLKTTPQHLIFSGTPVMPTPLFYPRGDGMGSSSSWTNSFRSAPQMQGSEMYQMIDQSRNGVVPSSQPTWTQRFINNPNSMAAGENTTVWNPSNNTDLTSNSLLNPSQFPDYMPGFCPP